MEISESLRRRILGIKLIVMDCDGVLTDGRIIPLPGGEETKIFDVKDGHGMVMARHAGLRTAIISGRKSFAVRARAAELQVHHLHEMSWIKTEPYEQILDEEGLADQDACYIGDDVIDIPILKRAGFAVAVADAADAVKGYAHLITTRPGGRGAVREVIELILTVQGKWPEQLARYL